MSESASSPKRRSAIDTLVARDMTAVFWFLMAIITAAGCTWYTSLMSEALKIDSSFVVMDTSGSFYIPPGASFSSPKIDSMHLMLSDMVVESVLERTREGLTYEERIEKVFQKAAALKLRKYVEKEATYFRDQNVTQTFQIAERKVVHRGITTVTTRTTGRIRRTYYLADKPQESSYDFSITIGWRINEDIDKNKKFPSLVEEIRIDEFHKPETEAPKAPEQ